MSQNSKHEDQEHLQKLWVSLVFTYMLLLPKLCRFFFVKKEIHLLRTIGLLLSYRSILYNTNICIVLLVMITHTHIVIVFFLVK